MADRTRGLNRRRFLGALSAALPLLSLSGSIAGCGRSLPLLSSLAPTPTPPRTRHIGWLSLGVGSASPDDYGVAAFRQGLQDLGYTEGTTIDIVWREEPYSQQLPQAAEDLVRQDVEVIVASPMPAIRAAKQVTTRVPIVMAVAGNPVGQGLVESLARPGGNVTGLDSMVGPLIAKRLELLKEIAPTISRVGLLWESNLGPNRSTDVDEAAARLGMPLEVLAPADVEDFERIFDQALQDGVDSLLVVGSTLAERQAVSIATFAADHQIPAAYDEVLFVEAGGLMAYGANLADLYRRAATYVHKILNGANPAEMAVERPTTFDFVLNLKAAQALGLTIPRATLGQVTKVVP